MIIWFEILVNFITSKTKVLAIMLAHRFEILVNFITSKTRSFQWRLQL